MFKKYSLKLMVRKCCCACRCLPCFALPGQSAASAASDILSMDCCTCCCLQCFALPGQLCFDAKLDRRPVAAGPSFAGVSFLYTLSPFSPCPALPCSALPRPALPCPALPCPAPHSLESCSAAQAFCYFAANLMPEMHKVVTTQRSLS